MTSPFFFFIPPPFFLSTRAFLSFPEMVSPLFQPKRYLSFWSFFFSFRLQNHSSLALFFSNLSFPPVFFELSSRPPSDHCALVGCFSSPSFGFNTYRCSICIPSPVLAPFSSHNIFNSLLSLLLAPAFFCVPLLRTYSLTPSFFFVSSDANLFS